jgi:hypothetical protein
MYGTTNIKFISLPFGKAVNDSRKERDPAV